MGSDIGKPGSHKREAWEAKESRVNAKRYWEAKRARAAAARQALQTKEGSSNG